MTRISAYLPKTITTSVTNMTLFRGAIAQEAQKVKIWTKNFLMFIGELLVKTVLQKSNYLKNYWSNFQIKKTNM